MSMTNPERQYRMIVKGNPPSQPKQGSSTIVVKLDPFAMKTIRLYHSTRRDDIRRDMATKLEATYTHAYTYLGQLLADFLGQH